VSPDTAPSKYPEYRKQLGPGWWLSNRRYTLYMIRELTSFFISIYAIIYIYQLSLFAAGDISGYDRFVRNPATIGFSVVTLFFTLYHAVTWFSLMGRIQVVKLGPKKTATPLQAVALNLVLLLVISYVVVYLFILR
jgi:fumarate reductase subunit C